MMGTMNYLLGLELGACQSFEKMAIFPLRFPGNGGPEYITLKEALERGAFFVTEVSTSGSVPELMVENKGDIAVLLLDGEELAGAKQNRVLNTTILVGPKSATKIPVSCTEHGRWSYMSDFFCESGNVMAPRQREAKMRSVNASLRTERRFRSDQAEVWDGVARMSEMAGVLSTTGAMRDVFEAKKKVLDDYLKAFKLESGQKGILVFIGGEVAGLDFVSRDQAFSGLHAKLVKSYAMEAMLVVARAGAAKGEKKGDEATAREFLGRAAECNETPYESVGLGTSLRYEGRSVIGSALAVDDRVIHMAFFKTVGNESRKAEQMAQASTRRRFRTL